LQHVLGCLVEPYKGGIIDLTEAKKLQNLLCLGVDPVNTSDADHQSKFGLRFNEEVARILSRAAGSDKLTFFRPIFTDILLRFFEDSLSFLFVFLGKLLAESGPLFEMNGLSCRLFLNGFGKRDATLSFFFNGRSRTLLWRLCLFCAHDELIDREGVGAS